MSSISTKMKIKDRVQAYWEETGIWQRIDMLNDSSKIKQFLVQEYNLIPQKDRIGKGSVFIAQTVAKFSIDILLKYQQKSSFTIITNIFNFPDPSRDNHMINYALALMGEYSCFSESNMYQTLNQITLWINHPFWEVREMCPYPVRLAFSKYPEQVLKIFHKWLESSNENLRRTAIESLRPLAESKWLRDPTKNDCIIDLMSRVKADPSVYVRKSVGNNLKDLTKYMPEKILGILESWILKANIVVTEDLASKSEKELGKENYRLVWTMKHALRWLKERNPEYYPRIEKILGKNYVLYFNEKKNTLASPVNIP